MNVVSMVAWRARLSALLVVLLVALPLGAANVQYFCHSMGRLMDACCCPSARSAQRQHDCRPKLVSRDCCERLQSTTDAAPIVRERVGFDTSPLALVEQQRLMVVTTWPHSYELRVQPLEARAPPPRGPPLFVTNCSFLI